MPTAVTFVAALVVGLIVTPIVRGAAHRAGLLDQPGGRKIHRVPVPRLGGVGMAIAFGVALGVATLIVPNLGAGGVITPNRAPAILAGVSVLVVIGVIDDTRGMRALVKLGLQVAATALAWFLGLRIELFFFPWGVVEVGILSLPLTIAWVVGVINAINLIDGLDGLAAAVVLGILAAFGLIAFNDGMDPALFIIAATGGAAFGFLAYNLHPASIIMGDTGSMFLGFVVAAISISMTQDGAPPVSPYVPIIALGVPILDTIWAVIRRAASGSAIFAADRGHIHHQLLRIGLSQRDAMLILTAVSAALAMTAVAVARV